MRSSRSRGVCLRAGFLCAIVAMACSDEQPGAPDAGPADAGAPDTSAASPDTSATSLDTSAASPDSSPDGAPDVSVDGIDDGGGPLVDGALPDRGPDLPVAGENGRACVMATDCNSTYCVDGVCCGEDCRGSCRKCNLPGSLGLCLNVAQGEDPDNECVEDPVVTCRRDGFCDGMGACRRFLPAGRMCVPAICTGTTQSSVRTCDGLGTCQQPTTSTCAAGCANGVCPP